MSILSNSTTDKASLTRTLNIGTNDFSLGVWAKRFSDRNTYGVLWVMSDAGESPSTWMGLFFDGDGTGALIGCSPGTWTTTYQTSNDIWYWLDATRTGGNIRCRVFNESGTKLSDLTAANSSDYNAFTRLRLGETWGAVGYWLDGEMINAKYINGVAWSDAQSWDEAKTFRIQTPGGVDSLAFPIENSESGRSGFSALGTASVLMTNSGFSTGYSRPSALEAFPSLVSIKPSNQSSLVVKPNNSTSRCIIRSEI